MFEAIPSLKLEAEKAFASVKDLDEWESLRVKFLGKKSRLQDFYKDLAKLSSDEKPKAGKAINDLKVFLEKICADSKQKLSSKFFDSLAQSDALDISEPGLLLPQGRRHVLTRTLEEVEDIFLSMGFSIFDGPEVESEDNNFKKLNIPDDHPARDMQDTFWLSNGLLMRTHTSPIQVRSLLTLKPPFRGIAPGMCFRCENQDVSHEHSFAQVELIMVDKIVGVGHLVGLVRAFLTRLFRKEVKVRLRPGYFPFVEPGFEVDFSCLLCSGKGCGVCKRTGWMEFMGAGLVHPEVFRQCGHDPLEWQGCAFGFGVERLAMMRHAITDIRHFRANDIRFLEQF